MSNLLPFSSQIYSLLRSLIFCNHLVFFNNVLTINFEKKKKKSHLREWVLRTSRPFYNADCRNDG